MGQIDRRALGRIVFGPRTEQQTALRDLERIVHPKIRQTFIERIAQAAEAGKAMALLDAAVLFEAGWNDLCHSVVFIQVPREERIARVA